MCLLAFAGTSYSNGWDWFDHFAYFVATNKWRSGQRLCQAQIWSSRRTRSSRTRTLKTHRNRDKNRTKTSSILLLQKLKNHRTSQSDTQLIKTPKKSLIVIKKLPFKTLKRHVFSKMYYHYFLYYNFRALKKNDLDQCTYYSYQLPDPFFHDILFKNFTPDYIKL